MDSYFSDTNIPDGDALSYSIASTSIYGVGDPSAWGSANFLAIDSTTGKLTSTRALNGGDSGVVLVEVETADSGNLSVSTSFELFIPDAAAIKGTTGDDAALTGTGGNEWIFGDSGDDTVTGGGGQDSIHGGSGNDSITATGSSAQLLFGGAGNDTITSASGDDSAYGGAGDDYITAGAGDDYIAGQGGDDTIIGGFGADEIHGGAGDDVISGDSYTLTELGNLQLWLDAEDLLAGGAQQANGSNVTLWKDKSGNGNDAANTVGDIPIYTTNALNGKAAVTFTDDRLNFPTLTLGAEHDIIMVTHFDAATDAVFLGGDSLFYAPYIDEAGGQIYYRAGGAFVNAPLPSPPITGGW